MSIIDPAFLMLALPLMAVLYHLVRGVQGLNLQVWLIFIFSAVIYALFGLFASAVLAATVIVTYLGSALIARSTNTLTRRIALTATIVFNVSCLVLVKYHTLFLADFKVWLETGPSINLIVPLGLSFFTIQQIGYAFDVYRRRVELPSVVDFASFVIFFPQLAAGPIVRYRSFRNQIDEIRAGLTPEKWDGRLARGLTWFAIGAFKKAVLAEEMFTLIMPYYNLAAIGEGSAFTSLITILGATVGLYFDFSGYADMAIGIGLMFGLKLPINFNAPFRFQHMRRIDRYWHITFHDFLRDTVFVPLCGQNPGTARKIGVAALVFVLVVFWHSPEPVYGLIGLSAAILFALKIWMRSFLQTSAGQSVDYAVTFGVFICACGLLVAPNWAAAQGIFGHMTSIDQGIDYVFVHPAHSVSQLVLLGAVFLALPFEVPTHALFGGDRLARLRRFGFLQVPEWRPNLIWGSLTIGLLLISFSRAQSLREVLYFGF
jgi:alginate O-acetyltransferase complex protein AlgI